jgi:hypothetical protein
VLVASVTAKCWRRRATSPRAAHLGHHLHLLCRTAHACAMPTLALRGKLLRGSGAAQVLPK